MSKPIDSSRKGNGQFVKGGPGGPGRPKGPDLFAKSLRKAGEQLPTPLHYKLAARGLGLEVDEIQTFDTVRELNCWLIHISAVSGDTKMQGQLLDREAPKPTRQKDEGANHRGRAPSGSLGASSEAAGYIERLSSP
ncbi:hypothetical protein LCGC14_0793550 [marine sediment metagenome]|uniref:Uncharacterized protein n=1 Tax=marine sediment metagenome TaxID=412755 RepID=A0A0F9SBT2_9ZZZZ